MSQQDEVDAELIYRQRGRLLYDDSRYFLKINDFIFLFWGGMILAVLMGMNGLFAWCFYLAVTDSIDIWFIPYYAMIGILLLFLYIMSAFLVFLFFYVLRTNPVKVYENGFELGWRNSPDYHPYSDVQKFDVDKETGSIDIKFKSYKTYKIDHKLPADYKVSPRSLLIPILREQLDRAWSKEVKRKENEAKAKAQLWAAKAKRQEIFRNNLEKVKYLKSGLDLFLPGLLWISWLPIVGLIMMIAGTVNFFKGKNEFGTVHRNNVIAGTLMFSAGITAMLAGSVLSVIFGFLGNEPLIITGAVASLAGYGLFYGGTSLNIFVPAPKKARIVIFIGLGFYILTGLILLACVIVNFISIDGPGWMTRSADILGSLAYIAGAVFHWGLLIIYTIIFIITSGHIDRSIEPPPVAIKRKRSKNKKKRSPKKSQKV